MSYGIQVRMYVDGSSTSNYFNYSTDSNTVSLSTLTTIASNNGWTKNYEYSSVRNYSSWIDYDRGYFSNFKSNTTNYINLNYTKKNESVTYWYCFQFWKGTTHISSSGNLSKKSNIVYHYEAEDYLPDGYEISGYSYGYNTSNGTNSWTIKEEGSWDDCAVCKVTVREISVLHTFRYKVNIYRDPQQTVFDSFTGSKNSYDNTTTIDASNLVENAQKLVGPGYILRKIYGNSYCSYNATTNEITLNNYNYQAIIDMGFRPESYTATITYYPNGAGGDSYHTQTVSGTSATLSFTALFPAKCGFTIPSGSTFGGWGTSSSSTSSSYTAGSSYSINANASLELYAIWQYSYQITYYKNDGSGASKTFSTNTGTSSSQSYTIPDPVEDLGWTRTGYYFQGWFNNSTTTGTQYLVGSTYKTSSDKSIYAHWQPNSYTIYFNGNGATSGSMSSMSCYYGSTYKLNSNAYKRVYTLTYNKNYTGASSSDVSVPCTFLYWSCNNSTYRDGASVSNLTSINGDSVTMYAQWEYGSVTLPTLIRSGYKFEGWYTSSGSYIGAGGSSYTVKSDQTIYAHWKEDVISPTISNVSHTDTTITISLNRNNATTGSWIIEASLSNFGTVVYTATITSTTQTTITLTGLTPETTYYIRARHVNGGVSASSNVISATTRTSTFQWTSDDSVYVIKSAVFTDAITATKWNELIEKVNWCRRRKGLSTVLLNDAIRGQPILATNFTAMRNAIADMHTVTPARSAGDEILATYFANSDTSLKSAINAVITTL